MTIGRGNPYLARLQSMLNRLLVLISLTLSLGGTALLAQDDGLQISLDADSLSIGTTVLCSQRQLENILANYSRDVAIHVDNSPDVATDRVLRLLEILRELGFMRITSNDAGQPGWTIYPFPKDLDIFLCDESKE